MAFYSYSFLGLFDYCYNKFKCLESQQSPIKIYYKIFKSFLHTAYSSLISHTYTHTQSSSSAKHKNICMKLSHSITHHFP